MVAAFDALTIHWLNGFVGRWPLFDRVVVTTLGVELIKDTPLVAGLWWIWFSGRTEVERLKCRFIAFAGTVAVLAGCLVSRLVQDLLPSRPRPLYTPGLDLQIPTGIPPGVMADYSSFPSDTATLAFSLATVIYLRSRRLGLVAYLWAFVVVSLPRVYVGFHYPLDVVGGALLGTAFVLLCVARPIKPLLVRLFHRAVIPVEQKHPALFYPALFIVSYQLGSVFEDVRVLGRAAITFAKAVSGMP